MIPDTLGSAFKTKNAGADEQLPRSPPDPTRVGILPSSQPFTNTKFFSNDSRKKDTLETIRASFVCGA